METPGLETPVKQMLTGRLGIPAAEITRAARLVDDLGMDSLDAVELAIAAERQFDITLGDDQVAALRTVADLIGLVERLVAGRTAGEASGRSATV